MRRTAKLSMLWLAIPFALAGCNESVKHVTRIQAPAPTPLPSYQQENLPLTAGHPLPWLTPEAKPATDQLIEQVQSSYEAGKADYKAGQADLARQDFNRAVNLIVKSGVAVDSDPRLQKLFDDMAETIHDDELEASREAAQEPEGEPAPIEEIAGMDLPTTDLPGLASKAEQEIMAVPHDLPLTVNEYVLKYLSFFQTPKGRTIVSHGLERAGQYSTMIRQVFKEEGMPQDLIYLAQAESSFKPRAVSRAGARGIWQFMPFRGQEYDLHRNYWIDERSDPEKATRAAAHHLRDLYHMFGDWYLAMAAYDSGPLNVIRAVERTGYADFWELYKRNTLPKETKNYVPIILALALVAKEPARYGIHVTPEPPAKFDTVKPGHAIDLRLVADACDSDLEALQQLNPALLRGVTPNSADFELRLPVGTAEQFRADVATIPPEKWTSWRRHRVADGESLTTLAKQFRVTPLAIAQVNDLDQDDAITPGVRLTIPTKPPVQPRIVSYRVQRGDTLEGIADRFNVTPSEVKRWNHLKSNHAPRGMRLRIYPGGLLAASAHDRRQNSPRSGDAKITVAAVNQTSNGEAVHHRVKPGETLYSIARAYRTTVAALKLANPVVASRQLEAGDLLVILPGH